MIKLFEKIYMFESKTNILLYIKQNDCYLIDSGKSEELAKQVNDFIKEKHLTLKGIINTHCHSDHVSNNSIFNSNIYASDVESIFIENYDFQLDILYGGKHPKFIEDTYLYTESFKTNDLIHLDEIEYIKLPGHSYNMIGVLIENKVLYIGDALFSEKELKGIPYLYDIEKFLKSIEKLKDYKDFKIISSHIGIVDDLDNIININKNFVNEINNIIIECCKNEKSFDEIMSYICQKKNISLNNVNFLLIESTLKSFISYLIDNGLLEIIFSDNRVLYKSNK